MKRKAEILRKVADLFDKSPGNISDYITIRFTNNGAQVQITSGLINVLATAGVVGKLVVNTNRSTFPFERTATIDDVTYFDIYETAADAIRAE